MSFFATPAFLRLIAVAAIVLAPGITSAQSGYTPPLWEVRSGENTVYLFGTIHVGKADFYPLPAAARSAFGKSDVVALEVDPTDQQAAVSATMSAMYTPPDSIENHIDPALLSSVNEVCARYGIALEQVRQMKPYLLMFMLTTLEYQRLGYSAGEGLESHFVQRAHEQGKQVVALESMSGQMQILDGLSPELQSAMLQITVDEITNGEVVDLVAEMIHSWRTGNMNNLGAVLLAEERRLPDAMAREFHNRFLTERNAVMAQKIERMLLGGEKAFIAVGAMHMVGEDGLPAMLSARGFEVRQLR
ncbi:MAG TPA: TraB/GumN family protein [Burkholderiales bacterium]|nr:TraB/GumN family protein [Burkholderiales bacterium]